MTEVLDWRERYLAAGYVVVREVLGPTERDELLADLATRPVTSSGLAALDPATDDIARRHATHPGLVALASSLLGGAVEAFGFTYVVKEPDGGLEALWHQDGHPWVSLLHGAEAVTLWVALDPATTLSGGLIMVPRSHLGSLEPLEPVTEPPNLFGWASPRRLWPTPGSTEAIELAPGDVSAHHPAMLHASGRNASGRPRRALSIRYRSIG